jgi:hypothetical protein
MGGGGRVGGAFGALISEDLFEICGMETELVKLELLCIDCRVELLGAE